MKTPSFESLTGRTDSHLAPLEGGRFHLHKDVLAPFARLKKAALKAGFELELASSFRDFSAQLRIWNEKAEGKRALLDGDGKALDHSRLSAEEVVFAILRWSALPGASRHHWGTDFDVFPKNFLTPDYKVQLVTAEAASGGIFEKFGRWLDDHLPCEGFYRPYSEDRGGVSPEWWHLSYAPVSQLWRRHFTRAVLAKSLDQTDLKLKEVVLAHRDKIYDTYVNNVAEPEE